jgi:polyphosphate glucokinase
MVGYWSSRAPSGADVAGSGAGFPSVIRAGQAIAATRGDPSWIRVPVQEMLSQRLGRSIVVLNDSDAAGVAEIAYGAGKGQDGVVLLLDLGTGIGSALFTNGQLVPNLQLGHIEFHGRDAETCPPRPALDARSAGRNGAASSMNFSPGTRDISGRT